MIGTINKAIKIKRERAFPGRFDWQCPECENWNRYFEVECPYCLHEAETLAEPDWDLVRRACDAVYHGTQADFLKAETPA